MRDPKQPPRQEFERKFLVLKRFLPKRMPKATRIEQGYLRTSPIQERVRIFNGTRAVFEIKGPRNFESDALPLPVAQARYLLDQYREEGTGLILKDRHELASAWRDLVWEVDFFRGRHRGLVIAEIEIPRLGMRLDRKKFPLWIGEEVTDNPHYKNKNLAKLPRS